jgi:hypothetical protein
VVVWAAHARDRGALHETPASEVEEIRARWFAAWSMVVHAASLAQLKLRFTNPFAGLFRIATTPLLALMDQRRSPVLCDPPKKHVVAAHALS